MRKFKGLLCDLDGTLVDSEPQHCNAWLLTLSKDYNLHYDEHWFEQWVGTSDWTLSESVIKNNRLEVDAKEMILAKQVRFHNIMRAEGANFPGIPEALAKVVAEFPVAIATNSGRADTDVVIPALGLDQFTEVIVTATDVQNMKPAPDIYLLAAKGLDLNANECIAIEDSPAGGTAAKAAGCYLIGLNDNVSMADEQVQDNKAAILRALVLLRGE